MLASQIPSYYRYGEAEQTSDVDLLHCQAIFSRISEQGWEIRPHRHSQLCQLFIVEEGALETVVETSKVTLIAPCVIVVPAGRVHGFGYGDRVRGRMISLSDGFLRGVLESKSSPRWFEAIEVVRFCEDDKAFAQLIDLFSAVEIEALQRKQGYISALASLLQLVFVHLDRNATHSDGPPASSRQIECFERFRDVVAAQLRSHWSVSTYCRQLGVGERRLNRICRTLSGSSPLAYIHRQLVEEAKRYLVHTAMPVSAVGYELGFTDSAYFSRFFKKHVGLSPSTFAAKHRT